MIVERTIEGRTEYLTVADDWLHPARQGKGWAVSSGPPYDMAAHKREKAAELHAAYAAELANGVTVGGITLAAQDSDQHALANGLTLVSSAMQVMLASSTTLVSNIFGRGVTDMSGNSHNPTAADYVALCLGYAAQIGAWQGRLAARLAALNAADTDAAINAIEWGAE